MNLVNFIVQFIYNIRHALFWGTLFVCLLTIFFTRFLPKRYVVATTVFTGITSKPVLSDMSVNTSDWNSANNAHDNIINLVKSKATLQNISIGLLAQHLIYGDPEKDNRYIMAKHYRSLIKIVPEDVRILVDKNSMTKTVENFKNYRTEDKNNFIYSVFSWVHRHYSYLALQKIKVKRNGTSDMIEISYESDDPGIAVNTLALLNEELSLRYEGLLLSTSNDVIKHFEEQLLLAQQTLAMKEEALVKFNIDNRIINYEEQTKHLAALNNLFESRYEGILLSKLSSQALLLELERQMDTRVKLIKENEEFLNTLSEISNLNGLIAEVEIFGARDQQNDDVGSYQQKLHAAENRIKEISSRIDQHKNSKEGVSITDMVGKWLEELIRYKRSDAELKVMEKRRREIDDQYDVFSPVGPNMSRMEREVRVAEESYLTILHHLGLAKLKQKNIRLNSGTLQIVTPPEYPLLSIPRKRELYLLVAFFSSLIFITGFFLLLEIVDRSVRDKQRAERLTGEKVIGVFPQKQKRKYQRFEKEIKQTAIAHLANSLNKYYEQSETLVVNLISIEAGEGKSYLAEQLQSYWQEQGFAVKTYSHHTDFVANSKRYLQTNDPLDLLPPGEAKPDRLIIEQAALQQAPAPKQLVSKASINLLVVDAERVWRICDQPILEDISSMTKEGAFYLFLNNVRREALEEVVGQLPPYTILRTLVFRLMNLGLTAKRV